MEFSLSVIFYHFCIKSRNSFDKVDVICLKSRFFILVQLVSSSPFAVYFGEIENVISDDLLIKGNHASKFTIIFLFLEQNGAEIWRANSYSFVKHFLNPLYLCRREDILIDLHLKKAGTETTTIRKQKNLFVFDLRLLQQKT